MSMRFFLYGFVLFYGLPVYAGLLNLPDTPLNISNSAQPNVFFMLDDSGSMDWEHAMANIWEACAYDPRAGGTTSSEDCGSRASDGISRGYGGGNYRDFTYIYKTGDNKYSDSCSSSSYNSIEACPDSGSNDWRFFSNDANTVYYNPDSIYNPWKSSCGSAPCQNANFSSARSNPKAGTQGYSINRNLGTSRLITGVSGFPYMVWIDDKGFTGTRPRRGTNVNYNTIPNGIIDLWDSYIQIMVGSRDVKIYKNTFIPTAMNLNKSTTLMSTLTDGTQCYNVLGGGDLVREIFNGSLSYTSTGAKGCRTIAQAKQNIANWYQYGRRRSLVAKSAIDTTIDSFTNFRYGLSVINNNGSLFVPMPSANVTDRTAYNASLLSQLTSYEWPALGTPLLEGLTLAGNYYGNTLSGKPSPILYSCQQNFTILLTDGYWSDSSSIGDIDGDGYQGTLADVARFYYLKNYSPGKNDVIPSVFDPLTYQHMVTFTVGLGVQGNLVDTDDDGWPNPMLQENSNWGDANNSNTAKVDDLWHAAYNSKGGYVSAQSPKILTDGLSKSLNNITARVSAASVVSQNSTVLQTDSLIYRAQYDSQKWFGSLYAYPISLSGVISTTPSWDANCLLSGGICNLPVLTSANNPGILAANRIIITPAFNNPLIGAPFRWPSSYTALKVSNVLPTRVSDLLTFAPYAANTSTGSEITANQAYGQNLIDYLRGDRAQENQNGGSQNFRNRSGVLGDIVNSAPLYIGPPSLLYRDSLEASPYSAFKTLYQNRVPMLAVGANDGMMHIFNASTGKEMLAFVPSIAALNANLPLLTQSSYAHKYYVDGSATAADVFFNNQWQSILVSPLRKGGRGIFALNITDPASFSEANAANIFLWEFSAQNDVDLGYVYGKIQIAKVRTGSNTSRWAAIFGNGYNNTESNLSQTGQAALFIVYLDPVNGGWTLNTDYIKIPVGPINKTTPNGLAEPSLVDIEGDQIVDYVYAGDLLGNMWKFDLRSTDPLTWKNSTTLFFTAKDSVAGDQPITAPAISRFHPNGTTAGLLLYFGTGKYLENSDNTGLNQSTQSFYCLWDKLEGSLPTKAQLLKQEILSEVSQTTNGVAADLRQTSNYAINWSTHMGWYMDLKVKNQNNLGERVISEAIFRNKNVIFSTLLPSLSVCSAGGSSWLMELNADNGAIPLESPFDLNNDGLFDASDYIIKDSSGNIVKVAPSGKKSTVGMASTPAIFLSPDRRTEIKVISGATGLSTITENPGKVSAGRQNWKRIN